MPNPPPSPTPDQSAAHEFLTDLRTRITTQPLPYQYGVEARALESLWDLFTQAREAAKKYPGCGIFAAAVTGKLNLVVRPLTAKWHRAHEEGRLLSHDGADAFRVDLELVQRQLQDFAEELHAMAYGTKARDALTPPAMAEADLAACLGDLPFGLPSGTRDLDHKIIDQINRDEAGDIQRRRDLYGLKTPASTNAVGLALSGGGIRSATFCLGVTQVLAERGLLKEIDFLSTVSGGGYTGSFLSVRLGTGAPAEDVAGPRGPDPKPIRYVRHHAKFLNPVNLKDGWTMVTATLAGMLLNWTAPLLVISIASFAAVVFAKWAGPTFWPHVLAFGAGLTGAALLAYCGLLRQGEKSRVAGSWLLGITTALTAIAGACWLADWGYLGFEHWLATHPRKAGAAGLLGALITAGPAVVRFFPLLQKPAIRQLAMKVLLWLAALVIPLGALLLFYLGRHLGDLPGTGADVAWWDFSRYGGLGILGCLVAALALVAVGMLNVNLTAPHRLYRDRLARTFIHTSRRDDQPVVLKDLNPTDRAPYHLINTTLNLPSSELPSLRDRKCAFFLFSKHWTGSATTGYFPTDKWKTNGRPVDLATAMAVSGAAASSYMGLGSMPTLTALLTFLNIRLGFWIRHPSRPGPLEAPGFACLLREMAGVGMNEKAKWLNLSDGGHIENTGVYELLRRRCKFILSVDGEADPGYDFGGLLTLVRHAQIDYGIRIEPEVKNVRPDAQTGCSQTHALFCRIHYPAVRDLPAGTGLLLYVKLSLTGNENELINRYRKLHPEFPHESTADQFFKEEQFEAYRQLGVHVADVLFSPALLKDGASPANFAGWFRQLAAHLLVP